MSAVLIPGESRLRAGAIGLALAAAVAGLIDVVSTSGVVLLLAHFDSLAVADWGLPRWTSAAALLLLGGAGLVAWRAPRHGRLATALALVSAVGVAGAAVWATQSLVVVPDGSSLARLACHALLTSAIVAVALVWARPWTSPVAGADVALGAVVGTALTTLPGIAELAAALELVSPGTERTFAFVQLAAGGLLVLAAVLAMGALAGRVPALPVAVLTLLSGALLLVLVARSALRLPDELAYGSLGMQLSTVLALLAGLGQALVAVVLGVLLLRRRRDRSAAEAVYGSDEAAASWQTPTT